MKIGSYEIGKDAHGILVLATLFGFFTGFAVATGLGWWAMGEVESIWRGQFEVLAAERLAERSGVTVLLEVPPANDAAVAAGFVARGLLGVDLPMPAGTALPRWACPGRVTPVLYGAAQGQKWYYQSAVGQPIEGPFDPQVVR